MNQIDHRRNSNLEILRIFSMLLIIAGHLTVQSNILNTNYNKFWAILFGSGYGIADNIFVLISAYFLVDSKFSSKRIFKVYYEIMIITFSLSIIMLFIGPNYLNVKDIVRTIFTYSGSPLWFGTCYISMLFFSPFLNKLIKNNKLNKKILLLLFFINVVPSTFLLRNDFFYSGEIVYFCFLYLLVGYLKNEKKFETNTPMLFFVISLLIYFMLVGFYFFVHHLINWKPELGNLVNSLNLDTYFIFRFHTLPSLICSLSLFKFFINLKPLYNNFINKISSGVFTVYVIHQTPTFAPYMWDKIFKVNLWMNSNKYIVYYLLTVFTIFIFGILVDFIRKKLIDPIVYKSKIYIFLTTRMDEFFKLEE